MNTRVLLTIAATALLAACGSDDKSPTGPNDDLSSYTATVSGDVQRALSGQAAFGSDNTDPEIGFGLALVDSEDDEPNEMVLFYRGSAGIPGTGALPVADAAGADDLEELPDNQMIGVLILDVNTANPAWCHSQSGDFNVTSSTSNRLKGNYDIAMACVRLASMEEFEVELSGNFDAVGGAVVIPNM
jgi:hypothetical protein